MIKSLYKFTLEFPEYRLFSFTFYSDTLFKFFTIAAGYAAQISL